MNDDVMTTRAVTMPNWLWQRISILAAGSGLPLDVMLATLTAEAVRAHYAHSPQNER